MVGVVYNTPWRIILNSLSIYKNNFSKNEIMEQLIALTAIDNAVKQDNNYITLIVGNPDKQAAEEALD